MPNINTEQAVKVANSLTQQALGEEAVQVTDLSNIAEVGQSIVNAMGYEAFLKTLPDHIGRVQMADRIYKAESYGILQDAWMFGSIKEKIDVDLMEASEAMAWKLVDGQSYDPNVFVAPTAHVDFWNTYTPLEVKYSRARKQTESAFSNGDNWMAFLTMIANKALNSKAVIIEDFARATIVARMAENVKAGKNVINVLSLYNTAYNSGADATAATFASIQNDPVFWRFFSDIYTQIKRDMTKMSTMYNLSGRYRFTPADRQLCYLMDWADAKFNRFLQSDTFHNELTSLGNFHGINFLQGTGTTPLDYASRSEFNVVPASGGAAVKQTGVLGAIQDVQAAVIDREREQTRVHYNPDNDTDKTYLEWMAGQHIDNGENCVIFVAA